MPVSTSLSVPTCRVRGPQRDGEETGGFRIYPQSQQLTPFLQVVPTQSRQCLTLGWSTQGACRQLRGGGGGGDHAPLSA